jgi:hypothetical protein
MQKLDRKGVAGGATGEVVENKGYKKWRVASDEWRVPDWE